MHAVCTLTGTDIQRQLFLFFVSIISITKYKTLKVDRRDRVLVIQVCGISIAYAIVVYRIFRTTSCILL